MRRWHMGRVRGRCQIHLTLTCYCHSTWMPSRRHKGEIAYNSGLAAEDHACAALVADGWTILGRRLRTAAGEVDAVAEKAGLLAIIEVKYRPRLSVRPTTMCVVSTFDEERLL
ncbi:MAG: YraN family protein [Rhodopila sp.]